MAKKILSKEEVLHLAKLANIILTEDEVVLYQTQLSNIIGYVEKLNSITTENIEPVAQLTELINVSRDDETSDEQSLSQNEALQNTQATKEGYIKVKAVFDE